MGYNKITLYGGQVCDYLYIQNTSVSAGEFGYVNAEPTEWNDNTLLFAKFNNDLVAGNSSLVEKISGYEIRRKKGANSYTEYVGTIKESTDNNNAQKFMIDYLVGNNETYSYYLYPATTYSGSGILLSPSVTDEVKTNWGYWSLLVVDETEEENVFYLDKMFKFELNVVTDDMNNNAVVSVIQNFTEYPTIQYGASNYWSSSLTALCGFISCNDYDYIQSPNMINELKNLTSDTRRKFLKDMDGNIWEVQITSPIAISTDDQTLERIKTVKVSWTEVGKVSGISIINNPTKSSTNWLLTETGEVKPYINYVWGKDYKWDNSYRWTANNNISDTDVTNMGRDLFDKERDE